MKVKHLLKRLNEIVEANPDNAEADVRWYDEFSGHICYGDGRPIQMFYYPYLNQTMCLLNAVDGGTGYYVAIPDKGRKDKHEA